jgi:hypothetical protein
MGGAAGVVAVGRSPQQYCSTLLACFWQSRNPLRVQGVWHCQRKQFRGVEGFGGCGQQFEVQTLHQLTEHGVARGKAIVCQQGAAVQYSHQLLPKLLKACPFFGMALQYVKQLLHTLNTALRAGGTAPHPVQQGDQGQMPLYQFSVGVELAQQALEFL